MPLCHYKPRHGAALVELALVLPVVLLLVAALLEFSRASMLKQSADTAAYEAARVGIVAAARRADIIAAADSLLRSAQLKQWSVMITPTTIDERTAWVRVQVDVPVAENSWISPFFFRGQTISSAVTLVTERPTAVQLSGIDQVTSGNGALGINALGIGL